jgi:hypothetical protein
MSVSIVVCNTNTLFVFCFQNETPQWQRSGLGSRNVPRCTTYRYVSFSLVLAVVEFDPLQVRKILTTFLFCIIRTTDSEIQAEQQDAISCLEDPVVESNSFGRILDDQTARYETMLHFSLFGEAGFFSPRVGMSRDLHVRFYHDCSVDDDFEYYKLWQATGIAPSVADATMDDTATRDSSVLSGVSKWGQNQGMQADYFFADDASFERQFDDLEDRFEVIAPEGKLGFIVGTPQGGGIPVVHAIKDTSVLADRVLVGDRLVSVDGMDCTAMTGAEVSQYISQRSTNHQRILEFVRVRANNAPGFG